MTRPLLALLCVLVVSCGDGGGTPDSSATPPALTATCGNNRVEAPEECDDGNARSDDGCLATCFLPSVFVAGDPHMHSFGCNAQETPEELAGRAEDAGLRV